MAVKYEDCLNNGIELRGKTFSPLIVLKSFCRTKLTSFGGTSERIFNVSCNTEYSQLHRVYGHV